jgi:hypothetical protein
MILALQAETFQAITIILLVLIVLLLLVPFARR